MIIDTHCHAWRYWPYEPPVPDPEQRGTLEQLLFEMDRNGVDRALLVCANIEHNPDNNGYIARERLSAPERIYQIADLDSFWAPTYHQPGAAERLQKMVDHWPLAGFTHYLAGDDDGSWLISDEGRMVLEVARDNGLLASIHCQPAQCSAVAAAAESFPQVPFLLHHLGHTKVANQGDLGQVVDCARVDNIFVKISGFYASTAESDWDFPFRDVLPIVRALFQGFGAQRLCWGSDYPVCRRFITYRQALEAVRTHCDFLSHADREAIMGLNAAKLLAGGEF